MKRSRVLAIGLDGYEPSIGETLMAEGRMPHLAALRDRSARFQLDHEKAKRTGLAWEHVSLGQSPEDCGRWTAVEFEPATYEVSQKATCGTPFLANLDVRATIFDAPYFDLTRAPNCRGVVRWGAHDPGVDLQSVPASLADEIGARFGAYPAERFTYGFVWHDADRARAMADAIVAAVDTRTAVSRWLFGERLPEWDFAMVVVGELHSAIEALWHGVDARHPLHSVPSAAAARDGLLGVYEATDRLVGAMCAQFPDAHVVAFSMHGMGPNDSDVATMVLLSEILHRVHFGRPFFVPRPEWVAAADGVPPLEPGASWARAVNACLRDPSSSRRRPLLARVRHRLGLDRATKDGRTSGVTDDLDWMPATRYRRFWPDMDAFALPSLYDGRIRINLAGREQRGRVPLREYDAKCTEISDLIAACRNPRTGGPVVSAIERPVKDDPLRAGSTHADLVIDWRDSPLAFQHPELGLIGPAPYRRTGGHTGRYGMAYVAHTEAAPGEYGVRSAFDVVPTIIELLGMPQAKNISGRSLL